ncbi:MAG: hydroxymethylbilane synthase [Sphaerobacteraceae bacterium]|nr:MAG: hydroxymethylbilane synthase [Sphaerobacteraceae bacterium]
MGQVFPNNGTLRVGTRGSALALRQTERVVELLNQHFPDLICDVQVVSTAGDRDKQTSLQILGGQGIFAKELQLALTTGEIDMAVHSVKDLTSILPPGLKLGAILEREDPRDVIISNRGRLEELPAGSTIGTSSRRRIALIKRLRPDLEIADLRGNIDTRIRKATEGPLDAAVIAAAGVDRMGWTDSVTQHLSIQEFVPAPGQGALGIEVRDDNHRVLELLEQLNEPQTAMCVEAERAFLRAVGGGCTSPIGAHARIEGDVATLTGMLATENLEHMCIDTINCKPFELADRAHLMAAGMLEELSMEVRHR